MSRRHLWQRRFRHPIRRVLLDPDVRYGLIERVVKAFFPEVVLGERKKAWNADEEFLSQVERSGAVSTRQLERYWVVCQYVKQSLAAEGLTAECGVYLGVTSWFICENSDGRQHFGFDSFSGLSKPGSHDGDYWTLGDLSVAASIATGRLARFPNATLLDGWIPDRFAEVSDQSFSFVHIDVDLYRPTLDSLEFFYPRLVPGGVIVLDDYGFVTCPGARKAADGYMASRQEMILHLPTGQGVIVRQPA